MLLVDVLDITFALAGIGVAGYLKTRESILLALFFVISSISSFFFFETDNFYMWPTAFTFIIVLFGLSSLRNIPVVAGYIAYLIVIGVNEEMVTPAYSYIIYSIFSYQLWMVRHDPYSGGSRDRIPTGSHTQNS